MKIKITHKFYRLNTHYNNVETKRYMARASALDKHSSTNCFLIVFVTHGRITDIRIRYTVTPYLEKLGLDNTTWYISKHTILTSLHNYKAGIIFGKFTVYTKDFI